MCRSSAATLSGEPANVARARDFCVDALADALPDQADAGELIDDCVIVVSELVTNAINAGSTEIGLNIVVHRDHIRIETDDTAPGHPQPRSANPDDNHGRGLRVITHLSRDWGVDSSTHGKRVWADIAIPAGLSPVANCLL